MSDDRSDNPVFVYAAVYADRADADADYDTLLDLHEDKLVGTYDVALVFKDDDGKVHVTYTWKRQRVKHAVIDPARLTPVPMTDGVWPSGVRP